MKTLALLLAATSCPPAFAKAPEWSLASIATNPEVVALVSAMEKNRGLRCDALRENAVTVRKDGYATALYSCNQYDAAGEPLANVTAIELKGWATADSFDLMRVKFIPLE